MRPIYFVLLLSTACSPALNEAPAGNYDLVARTVTHEPEMVEVGDKVVFTTTMANQGQDTIPARTYRVEFYVDGERVSFDHATHELAPAATSSYSMSSGYHHFKPTKPGTYSYRFVLDPEDNLRETDENNNLITGEITVGPRSDGRLAADALHAQLGSRLQALGEAIAQGEIPAELALAEGASTKNIEWFHLLGDEVGVVVRHGDEALHPMPGTPEVEKATHRLEFNFGDEQAWTRLTAFLRYDEGEDTFYLLPRTSHSYNSRGGGWLGIHMERTEKTDARGVRVGSVIDDSPAQQAGLRAGDLLRSIDGVTVISPQQVALLVRRRPPSIALAITLERDGTTLTKEAELAPRRDPSVALQKMTGEQAPPFTFELLATGEAGEVGDFQGKVLLLEFWATWCGPCVKSIPDLNDLRGRYGEEELAILAVSDETRETLAKFARKEPMDYAVALSDAARGLYQVHGIPTAFLIDAEGVVRWSHTGYGSGAKDALTAEIERLLAERRASL